MKQNVINMKKTNLILIVLQLWIANFANGQGNVSYIPFYTQSTFNAKTIDLTKAVGATAGSASVSNGAAVYSLPLMAPPRPEIGVPAPEVSIQYSSMAGDGVLGKGWNIAGMSSIQRVQKTIAHNSVTGPLCTGQDEYMWDGNKLYKQSTGTNTIEYWNTENETFAEIKSSRDGNGRISEWDIITKDGNRFHYGGNEGLYSNNYSNQNDLCNVPNGGYIAYYLDYIEFPNGNIRDYSYLYKNQNEPKIKQITDIYGNINFYYKNRLDNYIVYIAGTKIEKNELLDNIVVETQNGEIIKKYNFKYSTDFINTVLSEIEEEGSNGEKLNPTVILYGEQKNETNFVTKSSFFSYPVQSTANGVMAYQAGDFNGDGLSDIVSIDQTTSWPRYTTGYRVFINNGNNSYNQTYVQTGMINTLFQEIDNKYLNFSTSDFNGDGIDDIIINNINISNNTRKLVNTTINYFDKTGNVSSSQTINYPTQASYPTGNGNYDGIYPNWKFFLTGDFNGDGGIDYLLITSNTSYRYFISFPSINIYNANLNENSNLYNWMMADNILVLDMDGDGKSEIMVIKDGNTKIYSINKIGNSNDFEAKLVYDGGFPTKWHKVFLGDFNGDGKTDLLTKSDQTGYDVSYSTGNNFNYITTINFQKTPNLANNSTDFLRVSDFNGDGKSDVIHTYTQSGNCNHFIDLYYSNGNSFARKSHDPQNSNFIYFDYANYPVVGDFNGDGKSDFNSGARGIWTGSGGGCSWSVPIPNPRMHVFFDGDGKDLFVKNIKNGIKSLAKFEYNTLTKIPITNIYNGSSSFNGNTYIKIPINVVTEFMDNDKTYTFNYYGAMLNKKGRGFLGFRQIDQTDLNRNETTSIYLNKYGSFSNYPDFVYNDYTEKKRNNQVLETSRIYYTPGINDGQRLWLKKDKVETTSYLNGNNTENTVLDNYGNIVSKEAIAADGKITKVIYNYGTNVVNRPAMPISSTTTYTKSGVPDISYSTQYEYTPMYQIKKKSEFAGLSKTITSEYLYNWVGNLTEEKITGANMTSRKNETVYDPLGMYVVKKKNTLGQESSIIMDAKWNAPLSITDIGGLTTTIVYDGFGRKISETLPTGKIINTEYLWDNSINTQNTNYSVYKIKSSTSNSPIAERYFDKMNREIATKQQQFDGSYTTVLKYYDSKNRNYLVDNIDPLGQRIQAVQNQYDDYDRVTNLQHIDKYNTIYNMENVSYTQGTNSWEIVKTTPSSITNPIGKSSYTKIDFAGKVLESKENNKNTITYTYNAEEKVLKVNSGALTLSESIYDEYGRQTKLIDNSAGTQTYEYNALGEITQQKNPNDGFIKCEFDVLGRKTKEVINEGTINYVYYPNGSGAKTNLLKEIKGFNSQNRELYDYDNFGRLIQSKKFIFNSPSISNGWITNYVYNADGKIIQKTSPTGNVYNYQYNSYGFLTEIKKGNQSIYTHLANTASGKPYQFNLGSQTTTMSYDDLDRLSSIQSPFYNEAYIWDNLNGNLISKNDIRNNMNYSYEYDAFERLTLESLNGTNNNALEYLDDGRVKQKATVTGEDYLYHTNKTFAVKNITDAINFPIKDQSVTYNSFNKATKIAQGDYELNYTYNHAYDRLSASLYKNRALQYNRYYCSTTDFTYDASNALKYAIDYVYAGNQLVALDITEPNKNEIWYVQADYQNTIRTVFNDQGQSYTQSFDAWGNWRESDPSNATFGEILYERPASLPEWLYRGYTEQEHLPEFRLINLNARLYDPHVGRMLSPDNFVTANSLQGLNRYSYAHNNPIKYSDPDGNFPILAALAANFVVGSITGLADAVFNGNSSSLTRGFEQSWYSLKISAGLFATNEHKDFLDNALSLLSRFTWQLPQTAIGWGIGQGYSVADRINHVESRYGATVIDSKFDGGAFTVGSFILGPEGIRANMEDFLFVHEYGHYIQSQRYGLFYMSTVALPSLIDYYTFLDLHHNRWYEAEASMLGGDHFASYNSSFRLADYQAIHPFNPRRHWSDFPISLTGGIGGALFSLFKF